MPTRQQEIGCAKAYDGNGFYSLDPACYAALKQAWMRKDPFFTGKDLYGDELVLDLAKIIAVSLCTPGGIAAWEDDDKEAKAQEVLA